MINDQPPPQVNQNTPIADLVMADIQQRKQLGTKRYGTPLQAHNGRDALIDAYQEAIDLCLYLRQAIEERLIAEQRSNLLAELTELHQSVGGYDITYELIPPKDS